MKTKKKISVIEKLRAIRDKISLEIKDMTFEELKKYLENKQTRLSTSGLHKRS